MKSYMVDAYNIEKVYNKLVKFFNSADFNMKLSVSYYTDDYSHYHRALIKKPTGNANSYIDKIYTFNNENQISFIEIKIPLNDKEYFTQIICLGDMIKISENKKAENTIEIYGDRVYVEYRNDDEIIIKNPHAFDLHTSRFSITKTSIPVDSISDMCNEDNTNEYVKTYFTGCCDEL